MRKLATLLVLTASSIAQAAAATPAPPAPAAPPATAPASSRVVSLPTFGVEFTPPAGWQQNWERDLTVVAHWIPPKPSELRDVGLLVTLGPLGQQQTARTEGDQWAKIWNVPLQQVQLGDKTGFGVVLPEQGLARLCIENGRYLYNINFRVEGGFDPAQFETVRASWKWHAPHSPAKHLELEPDPVRMFERFAVQLPACVRPDQRERDGQAQFDILSYVGPKLTIEFAAQLDMPDAATGMPIDRMAPVIGEKLASLVKSPRPVEWKKLGTKNDRMITAPVLQTDSKLPAVLRNAIIAPDAKTRVIIYFTTFATDPAERDAYNAAAEKIVESIEPAL
jgi:hypothetical protein